MFGKNGHPPTFSNPLDLITEGHIEEMSKEQVVRLASEEGFGFIGSKVELIHL
jgi:hypothetical protein